jgi:sulfoxide reductase heme-binding subunit YedZ
VLLDQALMFDAILGDILKRPFIMFGMAGLVMLAALAATCNRFSIRKMGKSWIWLHRLIYGVTACGALHFALSTKILSIEQFIYIGLLIVMILYRSYRPILMLRQREARQSAGPSAHYAPSTSRPNEPAGD